MNNSFSRREALKLAATVSAASLLGCSAVEKQLLSATTNNAFADNWDSYHDRVWLGEKVWANPMEDWQVKNGAAEVNYSGGNRSIHALTHQLRHVDKPFLISVLIEQIEDPPDAIRGQYQTRYT